ncbi:GNAT family N-acetyltransferase [Nocardioides sp. KIGAM211]|uniref:GNAT family N-acetyltransferase n=1 Tax=Nocardioides luti TaxID=2761101 RepID=A0A7X0VCV7_9ACTN|nr:GNAT family N-acetyltransferase [Nocardioides luti]MBB6629442.1 GNAT family N-acetyltransferase [Nocardioides luti]
MGDDIRTLTSTDADEFGRLCAAVERDHPTPLRLTADDFREMGQMPGTRFFGAFDGPTMVGWSGFLASVQPACQRFLVDGDHDPARPAGELPAALLATALDAARAWHVDTEPDLPVLFVNRAAQGRTAHERLVTGLGFAPERYRYLMLADLADVPEPPALPDDLVLTTFSDDDSERLRRAHNEVFRDYPNGATADEDNWAGFMLAGHARHHLSYVLSDAGGAVAAYAFAHEYGAPASGRAEDREVYFPYIGTARPHRGRGLASALVARTLHAAAAEGFTAASLDVDMENPDGASGIYERSGFRVHHTFVEYALRESAPEPEDPAPAEA